MNSLRFISWNVHSLVNRNRLVSVLQSVLTLPLDAICLQETHLSTQEDEDLFSSVLLSTCGPLWSVFFARSPSHYSGGTAILLTGKIHPSGAFLTHVSHRSSASRASSSGSIISVDCRFDTQLFTLSSVYAPSGGGAAGSSRQTFFNDEIGAVTINPLQPNGEEIICGDFNCVANSARDRAAEPNPRTRPADIGASELDAFMDIAVHRAAWARRYLR